MRGPWVVTFVFFPRVEYTAFDWPTVARGLCLHGYLGNRHQHVYVHTFPAPPARRLAPTQGKHPSPTHVNGLLGVPAAMMAGGDLEAAVRLAAGAAGGGACASAGAGAGVGADSVGATASRGSAIAAVAGGGGGGADVTGRLQGSKRRRQVAGEDEEEEQGKGRVTPPRTDEPSMWKIAAILLARSYKSGHAM